MIVILMLSYNTRNSLEISQCYHIKHHIPVLVAQWLACRYGHIILQTPNNTELSWNGLHWE